MPTRQPNVVTWTADACRSAGFWLVTPTAYVAAASTHRTTPRTDADPPPAGAEPTRTAARAEPARPPPRDACLEPPPRQQGDQPRPDVDDHRGRARVALPLTPVERD